MQLAVRLPIIMRPRTTYGTILYAACLVAVIDGYTPPVYYMNEKCEQVRMLDRSRIALTKDVRLKLTTNSHATLERNWECSTSLESSTRGDVLLVQYRFLDTLKSTNCVHSKLMIFDSDGQTALNGAGNCGRTPGNKTFVTRGTSVTFRFTTDATSQRGQFDILVTSFRDASNNTCSDNSRFLCENDRCISLQLKCNGYNDCGDDSDEYCFGAGLLVGIILGCVVLGALCVTMPILSRWKRRRTYRRICNESPGGAVGLPIQRHTQKQAGRVSEKGNTDYEQII